MANLERALQKFSELPVEIDAIVGSDYVFGMIEDLSEKYNVNLYSAVVLIVSGELSYDGLEVYLKDDLELESQKAKDILVELKSKIFDYLTKRINFLNPDSNKQMSAEEERDIIVGIFEDGLMREIIGNPLVIEAVNNRIIISLSIKFDFIKTIVNTLLANQEIIANLTISAWLKDFIAQKGSGIFDDLVLTDYVLHSPNCQKLSDENRRLVQKLLLLYRNLKFFPESMPNDTGEGWEIIPIDDAVADIDRPALETPKSEEERHIDALKAESKAYSENSLEKKMIEEEINHEKKIEGLKLMLKRYPEGSLEWRAIMDEVRKLS